MTSYYLKQYSHRSCTPLKKASFRGILPALIAAAVIFNSCTETPAIMGLNLFPERDFVNIRSTDTISIFSYTEYTDSVPAQNRSFSYLGGMYDPFFGTTTSDFVAQLRLTRKWPEGNAAFVVDSVKMILRIEGAKGDRGAPQAISLYEITEMLHDDTIYYSKRNPRAGHHLGTFDLPRIAKDSVQDIEIRLPVSVGEYITRDTTRLQQDIAGRDFRSFFKGLYITVSEGTKSSGNKTGPNPSKLLLSLSFTGQYYPFYLVIYYHTETKQGQNFTLIMNDKSVRYNRFFHDFTTAEPGRKITNINNGIRDTLSYLQSFYGAYTRITFPGLESFKDSSRVSVNRARLTIPVYVDGEIYKSTNIPSNIFLVYKNQEGYRYIVPDFYMSEAFYNGQLNKTALNFTFNISAFIQTFIEGKVPESGLILSLSDSEYRNLILKANNNNTTARFELTYTRY